MRYSIRRIFCNICRNGLLYAVIAVHFALGAGLFIICMNYRMTSRELLEESRQKSMEGLISIEEVNGGGSGNYSISYDTYLRLEENAAGNLEILLTETFYAGAFLIKSDEDYMVPQWTVHFMNDNLFAYVYQIPRREGVVYVGEKAYENLVIAKEALREPEAYATILFPEGEFYIEGDWLMVDGKAYPYEVAYRQVKTVFYLIFAVILLERIIWNKIWRRQLSFLWRMHGCLYAQMDCP